MHCFECNGEQRAQGEDKMLIQEDNELLIEVGPDTPEGNLRLVAAAQELNAKRPKRQVKVLGEDFVVFRCPMPSKQRLISSRTRQPRDRLFGEGREHGRF